MKINYFLEDNNIYLRGLEQGDVDEWASWFNNPVITEYMNKGMFPVSPEEQLKRLSSMYVKNKDLQLAIIDKMTKALVGIIGLHKIDWVHRTADISIVIGSEESQGKGFGKKAVALIVEHAFKKLNLHKLTSGMWSNNKASEACFKSNGFDKEGCRKEQYFYKDGYVDELNYGLTRSQWERNLK